MSYSVNSFIPCTSQSLLLLGHFIDINFLYILIKLCTHFKWNMQSQSNLIIPISFTYLSHTPQSVSFTLINDNFVAELLNLSLISLIISISSY